MSVHQHAMRANAVRPSFFARKPYPALLLLSMLVFSCPPAAEAQVQSPEPVTQPYMHTHWGFQLAYPKDWMLAETNFIASHYLGIFLTINSQRRDLAIREQVTSRDADGEPRTVEYNSKTVLQQMRPGEAYLSIGLLHGPIKMMQLDAVKKDLRSLLATNRMESSGLGLSQINLQFFKRGYWWRISGYLCEPIQEADQRKLMQVLESFRFLDAPVANVAWAESLAWTQLPNDVRLPLVWPVGDRLSWAGRTVMVNRVDAGYVVRFGQGENSWKFLVRENGKVIPQTEGNIRLTP